MFTCMLWVLGSCTASLTKNVKCLQKYDYTTQYKPEKERILGDYLSQFPSRKKSMPIKLHENIHNIYFTPDKLNIVRGAVDRDPIHSTVYSLTLDGWPERIKKVPSIACHFLDTRMS